jgi:hypothetical protein
MAITNTIVEGGNTTKGVEGDRGGPKIYRIVQRYLGPAKMVQSSPKICEVVQSFLVMDIVMREY